MKGFVKFQTLNSCEVEVKNHKDELLGYIIYYPKWRKYVFEPDGKTFYDSECLKRIYDEVVGLDKARMFERLKKKLSKTSKEIAKK